MIPANSLGKYAPLSMDSYYLGKVESVDDPEKGFKLQVRIYPFYAGVDAKDLPWARPMGIDENHVPELPRVGDIVWCVFKDIPLKPFWVFRNPKSQNGSYTYIQQEFDSALSAVGAGSLTYPEFELHSFGDVMVVANSKKNEYTILIKGAGTYIHVKDGKVNICGSSPAAARKDDPIKSTIVEDPAFWPVMTVLAGMVGMTASSLTGKITGGSSKVNIG